MTKNRQKWPKNGKNCKYQKSIFSKTTSLKRSFPSGTAPKKIRLRRKKVFKKIAPAVRTLVMCAPPGSKKSRHTATQPHILIPQPDGRGAMAVPLPSDHVGQNPWEPRPTNSQPTSARGRPRILFLLNTFGYSLTLFRV